MAVNTATRCDVIWGAAQTDSSTCLCSLYRFTQPNKAARFDILKALCHLVMLMKGIYGLLNRNNDITERTVEVYCV